MNWEVCSWIPGVRVGVGGAYPGSTAGLGQAGRGRRGVAIDWCRCVLYIFKDLSFDNF